MKWKNVKKQFKRAGNAVKRTTKAASPYLKMGANIVTGGLAGSFMGGKGGGEDTRSAAAQKIIQGTKKQAGAGQISYNEEVWE